MTENLLSAFGRSLPQAIAGGIIGYADAVNRTNNLSDFLRIMSQRDERDRIRREEEQERSKQARQAVDMLEQSEFGKRYVEHVGKDTLLEMDAATVRGGYDTWLGSQSMQEEEGAKSAQLAAWRTSEYADIVNMESDANPDATIGELHARVAQGVLSRQQEEARADQLRQRKREVENNVVDMVGRARNLQEFNATLDTIVNDEELFNQLLDGDVFMPVVRATTEKLTALHTTEAITGKQWKQLQADLTTIEQNPTAAKALEPTLDNAHANMQALLQLTPEQLQDEPELLGVRESLSKAGIGSARDLLAADPDLFGRVSNISLGHIGSAETRYAEGERKRIAVAALDTVVGHFAGLNLLSPDDAEGLSKRLGAAGIENAVTPDGRLTATAQLALTESIQERVLQGAAVADPVRALQASQSSLIGAVGELNFKSLMGAALRARGGGSNATASPREVRAELSANPGPPPSLTEGIDPIITTARISEGLPRFAQLSSELDRRGLVASLSGINPNTLPIYDPRRQKVEWLRRLEAAGAVREYVETGKVTGEVTVSSKVDQEQQASAVAERSANYLFPQIEEAMVALAEANLTQAQAEFNAEKEYLLPEQMAERITQIDKLEEDARKLRQEQELSRQAVPGMMRALLVGATPPILSATLDTSTTALAALAKSPGNILNADTIQEDIATTLTDEFWSSATAANRLREIGDLMLTKKNNLFNEVGDADERTAVAEATQQAFERAADLLEVWTAELEQMSDKELRDRFPARDIGRWSTHEELALRLVASGLAFGTGARRGINRTVLQGATAPAAAPPQYGLR